ncbi:uncharacterized protein LOC62_04G005367 [Vanrija pseudolonga]|uniref:Uncharacterized protein n=1 Tax=Vanrija pseudolonga TaxID=143232 RepID=A0AAF0YDK2_9TREE|nr:hypothetical protein LOC62_04G005367 [Vanrija pseudolonga]
MPPDNTPPRTPPDAGPGHPSSPVWQDDESFSFSSDSLDWQPPDMSFATSQDITDDSIELRTPPGSDDDPHIPLLNHGEASIAYPLTFDDWSDLEDVSFVSEVPTEPYPSFFDPVGNNDLGAVITQAADRASDDVMDAMNTMDFSGVTELSVRLMVVSVVLEMRDESRRSGPAATFNEWESRRIRQFSGVYRKACAHTLPR